MDSVSVRSQSYQTHPPTHPPTQASCLQEEETAMRVDELQTRERTQKLDLQRFKTESENLQLKSVTSTNTLALAL